LPRKKKDQEEELQLPKEAREALTHMMLVRLKQLTDGIDPVEVADSILLGGSYPMETLEEKSVVVGLCIEGEKISIRLPGTVVFLIDKVCAYTGTPSRAKLILGALQDHAVPSWLALLGATPEDLSGSLSVFFRNCEARLAEYEFCQRAEKSIEPLVHVVMGYIEGGPDTWPKAMTTITDLMTDIESVKDNYWRQRLMGEMIRHWRRLKIALDIFVSNEVPRHQELGVAPERWKLEAAYG